MNRSFHRGTSIRAVIPASVYTEAVVVVIRVPGNRNGEAKIVSFHQYMVIRRATACSNNVEESNFWQALTDNPRDLNWHISRESYEKRPPWKRRSALMETRACCRHAPEDGRVSRVTMQHYVHGNTSSPMRSSIHPSPPWHLACPSTIGQTLWKACYRRSQMSQFL